jgi:hypothetical protein
MSWWWLLALPPALLLADRLLLRAERRGWIFYRRRRPTGGAGAAAFGPIFDVLQPSRTVLVQEQRWQQTRRAEQGNADPHLPGPE